MSDGDTRQDKELARASLKGLTAYAEQLAYHNKNDEIRQVRSLVDAISGYWGVDEKRDWTAEFDEKIRHVRETNCLPRFRSTTAQIKALNGLCRYAEEMSWVQGMDEIERIQEIPDIIRRLGKAWGMEQGEIDIPCRKIDEIVESLQSSQPSMNMRL